MKEPEELEIRSGFLFVASNVRIEGNVPIEILPGITLRAAMTNEIGQILEIIDSIKPPSERWVSYESDVILTPEEDETVLVSFEDLPQERWKYWVIAHNNDSDKRIWEVETLCNLLRPEFDIGFSVYFQQGGHAGRYAGWGTIHPNLVNKFTGPRATTSATESIHVDKIAGIGELWTALDSLAGPYGFIRNALANLHNLKGIPEHSDLRVVGLFSIIELLVTHDPRQAESLDSISHQVRTKLSLLRKRFASPVPKEEYFPGSTDDVVWNKLYKCRSDVAHGRSPDFAGTLQLLKSQEIVLNFLHANVQELIVLALREPELISDLRMC